EIAGHDQGGDVVPQPDPPKVGDDAFGQGTAAVTQGCSTLFTEGHRKYEFETAESGGVAVLWDCVGLIEPENIVGEASNSREDARIFSNARCIFAERDIARVVKLIFDPPVHANGDSSAICVNHAVAQIYPDSLKSREKFLAVSDW